MRCMDQGERATLKQDLVRVGLKATGWSVLPGRTTVMGTKSVEPRTGAQRKKTNSAVLESQSPAQHVCDSGFIGVTITFWG